MPGPGQYNCIIELDNDSNLLENHFYFSFTINDNLNIGVSYQTQKADGNLDYILYTGNYFPVDIGYPIFLYSVTRDYELERIDILSVSIKSTHNNISTSLDFTYNIAAVVLPLWF